MKRILVGRRPGISRKKPSAYTNHTLLPEALEKWPLTWFETMLPRHLEIILEINRRLLDEARSCFAGQEERVGRISLVEGGEQGQIRMANLAIVGSHSTNGVAAIHSRLLRTTTVKDLSEMFPERFNNKTNGVTPRRWLLLANGGLVSVIKDAIGESWITDLGQLRRLERFADDMSFRRAFARLSTKRRYSLPIGSNPPQGFQLIRKPCSIRKSNAFTNTRGNC